MPHARVMPPRGGTTAAQLLAVGLTTISLVSTLAGCSMTCSNRLQG
jgi:hypothetical protein